MHTRRQVQCHADQADALTASLCVLLQHPRGSMAFCSWTLGPHDPYTLQASVGRESALLGRESCAVRVLSDNGVLVTKLAVVIGIAGKRAQSGFDSLGLSHCCCCCCCCWRWCSCCCCCTVSRCNQLNNTVKSPKPQRALRQQNCCCCCCCCHIKPLNSTVRRPRPHHKDNRTPHCCCCCCSCCSCWPHICKYEQMYLHRAAESPPSPAVAAAALPAPS